MNIFLLFLLSLAIFFIILGIAYIRRHFRSQHGSVVIELALKKKDFMKALKLAQELAKERRTFQLYSYIARAYEGLSDISQAVHYYEDALALFSAEIKKSVKIDTLIKIGNIYAKREDILKASGNYLLALEQDPEETRALFELANINYKAKNYQKTVFHLEKLIRLRPDNWKAYQLIGNAYGKMGNVHKAAVSYEGALKLKIPEAHDRDSIAVLLSDAYSAGKSYREAVNVLRPLLNHPDFFEESFLRILKNMVSDNQMGKAVETGKTYIDKVTPRYQCQVLYFLGRAYFEQGEYMQAVDCWIKAYRINPDYADLKALMEKYKVLIENPALEYYYTNDDNKFDEFIFGNIQLRPVQPVTFTRAYKIFKGSNNRCLIFYRLPFSMSLSELKNIENSVRQEYLGNFSFTLYSLFGTAMECKGFGFYKKIKEISGEQFVSLFLKNPGKKA